jgi:hypothetical protein
MRYSHTIVLAVCIVTAFCIFFGWCLWNSCSRAIQADCAELAYRRDLEASMAAGGKGKGVAEEKEGEKT